ncbi:hypothetical protein HRW23_05975 [Streptomyces lunaelactis]|uniref:imine reductase family protein n=1 Tax=Streptomyces lunaelactis TaxID=1535768 RepID=UPI001584D71F|nr:hypothetical protein [Streptomyces lunaelactis]NUK25548.1 hypothetical protein [Streptomyces lunaelactis]NUK60239.1 hypothetical protein [Streptomyces lunaelactis]NUK74373.1 hypothetical protein [Streptomyces lunaelactis]NUK76959.1 hypothetical protein [Streptomyces lunaelactis]
MPERDQSAPAKPPHPVDPRSTPLATFRDQGISAELFEPFQAVLDRAIEQGHAADGLSRIADLLKK